MFRIRLQDCLPAVVLVICGFAVTSVLAQEVGETVVVDTPTTQDIYLAGRTVTVAAPVEGDVTAAGQYVRVERPVSQDVNLAGEEVRIDADIGDDVRAAGRTVELNANVAGHVVAAGERVLLASGRRVGAFAWLAGDTVRVAASVGQGLKIAGREAVVAAPVGGDVEVMAERIEIAAGARIGGDLIWRSETPPVIHASAVIAGRIVERPMPAVEPVGVATAVTTALVALASVLLAGVVIYLLVPGAAERAAGAMRDSPWRSLGIGLAALVVTPLVILLLLVSGVGVLLALILLALYLVALPLGWFAGAYGAARWAYPRPLSRGKGALLLLAAIIVLGLVQVIPGLGQLAALAVLLLGLGGAALALGRHPPEPAASGD